MKNKKSILLIGSLITLVFTMSITHSYAQETETKSILIASEALKANGIKSFTGLIAIVINKKNINNFKKDKDVSPYLLPHALKENWTIVIFLPENNKLGSLKAVYINLKNEVVGIIAGEKINTEPEKKVQIWRPVAITTDDGIEVKAYKFITIVGKDKLKINKKTPDK